MTGFITLMLLLLFGSITWVLIRSNVEKCPRHPGHTMDEVRCWDPNGFEIGHTCSACQDESDMALTRLAIARMKATNRRLKEVLHA